MLTSLLQLIKRGYLMKKLNENSENKKFSFTLKNGAVVELTKQDVIDNNLYKITDKIPDLQIADKLSDKNPFKKILQTFESGVQNKFLYYKALSIIFFCYLWIIQISAFIQDNYNALPMLFLTLWGTYAIIRLNIKPLFKTNTLRTLIKKSDYPIFTSSITYLLLIITVSYSFLKKDTLCTAIDWQNVIDMIMLNKFSYFPYLLLASFLISILVAMYNIQEFYERQFLLIEMKIRSISTILFSFLLYVSLEVYFPAISSDLLCANKGIILLFIALSLLAFMLTCFLFLQIFCFVYIFIKKISLHINNIY